MVIIATIIKELYWQMHDINVMVGDVKREQEYQRVFILSYYLPVCRIWKWNFAT